MRDDIPLEALLETHRVYTSVTSWYDGEQISDGIPFDSGDIEATQGLSRLGLSVPSQYAPKSWKDPLGTFGQRLNVTQTIVASSGEHTVNLGWFLVQAWDHVFPNVEVEGLSLEQLLEDYRLDQAYQAPAGSTFKSSLRALTAGLLPLDTSAMTDRTLPTFDVVEEDRVQAITKLRTEWPADIRVDNDGVLVATPERTVGAPVRSFRHGEHDAYVDLGSRSLRDEVYNSVVARGTKDDGTPVQAIAVDKNPASPTYFYGPYGRRNRFYESEYIKTVAQAKSTAEKKLKEELRRSALVVVTAPPDPRLEIGDTIEVVGPAGEPVVGLLLTLSLPLTASQGTATYEVEVPGSW